MSNEKPCPLCGCGSLARMFPQGHVWLVRCTACTVGLADPQPTDAELAEIYNAEYYTQFGYQPGAADAALARIKRATYARMLRQAERLIGSPAGGTAAPAVIVAQPSPAVIVAQPPPAVIVAQPPPAVIGLDPQPRAAVPHRPTAEGGCATSAGTPRLLDVGCGLGYSLLAGDDRGWDVAGLEPHGMAGKGLPRRLAERIVRGTLADFRPEHPLDLVSLIDVIEHVRDPVATIRQAAGLLRPGGVLMLATNNLASRAARKPTWVHFHRAHLWYFSPATLSLAVEKAGLQTVGVRTAWRVYNLQYVASILAAGTNNTLARVLARIALKITPRFLRLTSWPPLPEGMLLLARR